MEAPLARTTAAAAIALAFACAVAQLGCPGVIRTGPEAAPDLILVTWDTARADHVGPAAAIPGLTPRWNGLAEAGAVFETARTPTPLTLPAHASLLTGLLPSRHGARNNGLFRLDAGVATLAERLAARGWHGGAFVSAAVLDARYGLARGFETYDDGVGESATRHAAERSANLTVDAALAWLRGVPAEHAVFLWVHLFDPHLPWQAPAALLAEHGDGYRAEIAFSDAQTGRLLDGLRELGRLERSLVVLTADHGEGLGEHGELSHGYFAYDSTVKVPLALWAGPRSGLSLPAGQRIAEPVSLTDVAPTVADLLGLAAWSGDGRSLRPLLRGEAWPERELALENVDPAYLYGSAPVFGVVDRDGDTWFDLPQRERYDTAADPGQTRNLYDAAMAATADALFARHPQLWPPPVAAQAVPGEHAEQLAALGYLQTGGFAVDEADADGPTRVDPKQLLPVAQLWMEEADSITPAAALERADQLALRFGSLPALAFYRADRLQELGRRADAIAVLAAAAEAHPRETRLTEDLARLRGDQSRDAELALRIRAAMAANPAHPGALRDLATVLHRMGELAEAEALYRRWLETHPADDAARVALHRVLGARGELDGSLQVLREGAARRDHDPSLDCAEGRLLAWWLARTGEALPALRACRAGGGKLSPRELALLATPQGE
jgi:choline-sulfatase